MCSTQRSLSAFSQPPSNQTQRSGDIHFIPNGNKNKTTTFPGILLVEWKSGKKEEETDVQMALIRNRETAARQEESENRLIF